jgi:hypothetical protein
MGFLDRAKKLAEQAKSMAEDAMAKQGESPSAVVASGSSIDGRWGTPYVPGMLGRPGWREHGLTDPAAVLPIDARDRVGISRHTRSEIVDEPYGHGRRWVDGTRSAGLFYRLHADHRAWAPPPSGSSPDGTRFVPFDAGSVPIVLELRGLDDAAVDELARAVSAELAR